MQFILIILIKNHDNVFLKVYLTKEKEKKKNVIKLSQITLEILRKCHYEVVITELV